MLLSRFGAAASPLAMIFTQSCLRTQPVEAAHVRG